ALADRRTGIGCDQLILIEPPRDPAAQIFMRILNADGSEAEACGNGTRCIARLVAQESGETRIRIETAAGLLDAELTPNGDVAVDMGPARTAWHEIPLAREMDTARAALALGPLTEPVCTNIGNPHATFFVPDAEAIDLAALGPRLEHDKLFPERANIGVATILDRARICLRVWERGAGITRACGTGACAALVAASRRARRGHPNARIVVTGCAATLAPERYAALPEVDLVLDNAAKLRPESYVGIAPRPCPPPAGGERENVPQSPMRVPSPPLRGE